MTKTIIIGQTAKSNKKNPIVFNYFLNDISADNDADYQVPEAEQTPNEYKFIELICKNYSNGYDLMFAYNDPKSRDLGVLFIGHWNDGVVESA